jgi:chaperonin GroES
MRAEPLGDRVLIHPLDGQRQIGDVTLPDSAKEDFRAGIVVAVGREVVEINAGEKVLFGPFSGIPIQVAEQSFLVMRQGEIALRLLDSESTEKSAE